jgi:hypothetical protein
MSVASKQIKTTRREMILQMFPDNTVKLTCAQICHAIIEKQNLNGNIAQYLSGSVSSILRKLVLKGDLKYAEGFGIKGGHLYQLNK